MTKRLGLLLIVLIFWLEYLTLFRHAEADPTGQLHFGPLGCFVSALKTNLLESYYISCRRKTTFNKARMFKNFKNTMLLKGE